MTVVMSKQTRDQAALFSEFMDAFRSLRNSIGIVAEKYRACKEAGIDMSAKTLESHEVPPALVLRLEKIAYGKLLPDLGYRLLSAPDETVEVVSTLSQTVQRQIADKGVAVWRRNAEEIVPVEHVAASEAKRLVDPVTKRLLSAAEQAERSAPRPRPRDHEVKINLTYEQYADLVALSRRSGRSLQMIILAELVNCGVIKPKATTRAA